MWHSEHLCLAPRWFTLSSRVLEPVLGVGLGLAGIIRALTVTEGFVLLAGVVMWLGSRGAIDRGLRRQPGARRQRRRAADLTLTQGQPCTLAS